ncbi:glycoside hydrolase family 38 C-terminal domain-containing protein, partial [Bacillus sp. SIMBA_005]|uniref:glycoside hydrolase family 38 C-terminal domain-containing protein n=1 Tax=Bacillus sp. SIMBA_005 TaxID=3085754 RepID=UPI0039790175
SDEGYVLDNGVVRAVIEGRGLLVSLVDAASGRETIAPGTAGNRLQLFRDIPNKWDAWDVDRFYRNRVTDLTDVESISVSLENGSAVVTVARAFSSSRVTQTITLAPGSRTLEFAQETD